MTVVLGLAAMWLFLHLADGFRDPEHYVLRRVRR